MITSLLLAAAQYQLEPIAFIPSTQPEQQLGASFSELGDVDQDGISDFAIGSPGQLPESGWGTGQVDVISGATGAALYRVVPISATHQVDTLLGMAMTVIGDVNYDGVNEFVVGSLGHVPAYVINGADGSRLLELHNNSSSQYGMQLATVGDMTGDGLPEIAMGLPNDSSNGFIVSGRLLIYNGADGSLHYEDQGDSNYRQLGNMIAAPGDLNQDGIADLIIGGVNGIMMPFNGGFTALNGADFKPLFSRDRVQLEHSTVDLDAVGDFNHDGINDFLVTGFQTHPNVAWFQGITHLMSGADGRSLLKIIGDDFEDFGRSSTALGDMNGDGTDDIGVLSFQLNRNWQLQPTVKILSGNDGSLLSEAATPGFNFFTVNLFPMSDRNGDGRDELVVAIPENQVGIDPPNFLPGGEIHAFTLRM